MAGKLVLLVEDENRLRIVVTMMLEELGAEVMAVEDGESALAEYMNAQPRFDLVLLDMKLAGMDGPIVFDRLIDFDEGARVVLSSGIRPDESLLARVKQHGGSFIEKPYSLDQLSDVLGAIVPHRPK